MTTLATQLSVFLREHLPRDRGASCHTCETYAHTIKLLVCFAAERLRVKPSGLEIEQIDAAHLRKASDAQLQHFNAVLQEQLEELQAELQMRERRLAADYELRPRRALHPDRMAALISDAVADWNSEVFHAGRELSTLFTREGTKRWLKKLKAEARLS